MTTPGAHPEEPRKSVRGFSLDTKRLLPIALSQAVGLLCGIIGIKITSRLIAPADYGAYGLFLSCAPLGIYVVHAGLIKFVSRHWAGSPHRAGLLREVLGAGARKMPWLALLTLGASAAFFGERWWAFWPLLFLSTVFVSLAWTAQTALQAERAHWADFTLSVVGSVTRAFGPPLLYGALGGALILLPVGFALHTFLAASIGSIFLWRQSRGCGPRPAAAQLSNLYEGPLFVALAVAGWLLVSVNRWIVAASFGADAAGYFTLASNLTLIVTAMTGGIFVQYFQPGIFAAPSTSLADRRVLAGRIDRIAALYTAVALAGVVGIRAVTPWLIGPLIDERYQASLDYLVGAGCFGAAVVIGQFFHMLLLAGRSERACGPVDLSGTAVLITGSALAALFGGKTWFLRWLTLAPLIPWALNRRMARYYFLKS